MAISGPHRRGASRKTTWFLRTACAWICYYGLWERDAGLDELRAEVGQAKHRVVLWPPGEQLKCGGYSVLIMARLKENTLMYSFSSLIIPEGKQLLGEFLTVKEWRVAVGGEAFEKDREAVWEFMAQ